ncbi:MAG: PepSY domain-containing protein [Pseudomonadota bacterium]|nr:PepSY domain-containing protein [Pseudomonadota bacterium]
MFKTILTYGTTVTLTLVTVAALAQSGQAEYADRSARYPASAIDANAGDNTGDNAGTISLQQAANTVLAEKGGHITEVEQERKKGRLMFEIKGIDDQGQRYKLYLNAENGEVLPSRRDD